MKNIFLIIAFSMPLTAIQADPVSVKNFRQLIASFYQATAVPRNDADVRRFVESVRTRLPQNGEVGEISSPMVMAVTQMAGIFCEKMIERDQENRDRDTRHAHRLVDFRQAPGNFSTEIKQSVVQEYAMHFWRRSATDMEMQRTVQTFDAVAEGATAQEALKVLCVSMAASLDTYLF